MENSMPKIKFVQGWETGLYNPETCRMGGGYFNYEGWTMFENGWAVNIRDSSSGWFGTCYEAKVAIPDVGIVTFYVGYASGDAHWAEKSANEEKYLSIYEKTNVDARALVKYAKKAIEDAAWQDVYKRIKPMLQKLW